MLLPLALVASLLWSGGTASSLADAAQEYIDKTLEDTDENGGSVWALLVAGSSGWGNYRHQADICHAYQILKHGIPETHIITMMVDDIAYNERNPNKGKIINQPNGTNVYKGVKKDYTGTDVTAKNFLKILSGNKEAMKGIGSGRVIESTSKDHVFVFFSDHGSTYLLAFPYDILYAPDLAATLKKMHREKRYQQMVLYIEACEAGSMFQEQKYLSNNIRVLASTASAADESSWGWYCGTYETLNTCLGDLYSISWMEHMDKHKKDETLFKQYNTVRILTNKSHVNLYGDYKIGFHPISLYTGKRQEVATLPTNSQHINKKYQGAPARDIPLFLAQQALSVAKNSEEREQLQSALEELETKRLFADTLVDAIVMEIVGGNDEHLRIITEERLQLYDESFNCYKSFLANFNKLCLNTFKNEYLLGHFYKFANICGLNWLNELTALSAMEKICNSDHRSMTGIV